MLPEWVALQAGAVDKVWVPRNGLPQGSFEKTIADIDNTKRVCDDGYERLSAHSPS